MKAMLCARCTRIIKHGDFFWQSYYSKQTFCCASCAAAALGCELHNGGNPKYEEIFAERGHDIECVKTIQRNLEKPKVKVENEDYRFDLDFDIN